MASILLLFVCLLIGILLQRVKAIPKNAHLALNQYVIYVALPAMAMYYIPKIVLSNDVIFPILVAWIGFAGAYIFFNVLGNLFGWSKKLIGCLILTGGLGNTSFVGIPIIEALYGKEGIETLVMVDLPGTFVVLSTLGILVAGKYSRGQTSSKEIVKRVFQFPPFLIFLVGMCMSLMHLSFPSYIDEMLLKISVSLTPIALISVGLQLKLDLKNKHWRFLGIGLAYQLFIFPALIFLIYKVIFRQSGIATDVCIMEAAMAPMITACIVASNYGLKPKLSSMMVGVGIPLSFLTLAFWYWILSL